MSEVVQLQNVAKSYNVGIGVEPITVLKGISLTVPKGDSIAIVGPSGSGKSTLLNLLGTLDRPSSGKILLEGVDVGGLDDLSLAKVRNQRIGFVFQSHHLLAHCSALENVLLPTMAKVSITPKDEALDRARHLLQRVGLATRSGHLPSQLSGGERQRVAIVRALINHPILILADEPTGALDRSASASLADLLLELNQELGLSMVVATHSLELASKMKRRFEMVDGQLVPI